MSDPTPALNRKGSPSTTEATPASKKRRYQRALQHAVLPPLITMAVLGLFLILQVDNLRKAAVEVETSDQLIYQAANTQKLLIDMETGLRGYLLAGSDRFLVPYDAGEAALGSALDDLQERIHNDPRQLRFLQEIRQKYDGWHTYAEEQKQLRERGDPTYHTRFKSGEGKDKMDAIRGLFERLIEDEKDQRVALNAIALKQAQDTVGIVVVALCISGLVLGWNGRRNLNAIADEYEGALTEEQLARERLAITLTSIGDAVIVTDAAGRITMINTITEELTGWRSQDAIGRDASEIFDIHDERTGAPTTSPIQEVLREKRIVLLANHTVLRSRNGREIVIEDSAAPIRDLRGEIIGVVLVFRDVTERKQQELALAEVAARERRIAETLQRAMLLAPGEHAFPGLAVVTRYEAAWDEAQVGGDFHDAFALEDGKVALVVGDVMGKGLSAAARTAEVKYALRVILRDGSDVATALTRLNRTLLVGEDMQPANPPDEVGLLGEGNMVALVVVVLDPATGEASVAAAGSEPPLVARAGGEVEDLGARGVLLGAAPGIEYDGVSTQLGLQDVLLLYTDGISEAHRRGAELFGQERLSRLLKDSVTSERRLKAVGETLVSSARHFAGGTFHDDVCLLLARRAIGPNGVDRRRS